MAQRIDAAGAPHPLLGVRKSGSEEVGKGEMGLYPIRRFLGRRRNDAGFRRQGRADARGGLAVLRVTPEERDALSRSAAAPLYEIGIGAHGLQQLCSARVIGVGREDCQRRLRGVGYVDEIVRGNRAGAGTNAEHSLP